ncbi:MAG TPA: DUF1489 domain-containing protein [Rhizomicrobium sp.]|jgi:hypothetical protein
MTLHLIKLCVGCDSIEDLADWQKRRVAGLRKKRKAPELVHVTRMTPKRADELLDGGSLYWVIKGHISVRQKLVALKPMVKNGVPHCGLVYDAKLILVVPRSHRPFQGWRYLAAKDAPPDASSVKGSKHLPPRLRAELSALGLL